MDFDQSAVIDGSNCEFEKGKVVDWWQTGDDECDAYSYQYECGGVYNRNWGDVLGFRDHDCFWQCEGCPYQKENTINAN